MSVFPNQSALLRWGDETRRKIPFPRVAAAVIVLGAAAAFAAISNDYILAVCTTITMFVVLGLGLNMVVGWAGLLDLGYAAFFAIGAYTSAILTAYYGVDFWLSSVAAVAMAGLAGVIIGYPTLRLRSDYLAIVTLGFGEIVRTAFNNWDYVNGPDGIWDVPPPSIFGYVVRGQAEFFILIVVLAIGVWFFSANLGQSRVGRGWRAVRDDEACAEAIGIPTIRLKLWAYICGGMCGGLAGAFFASRIGLISPMSITYLVSFLVLNLVIIGGLGSLPGVILGAIVVIGLPEGLREIEQYRLLGFSLALIVLMLVRPDGLWPYREKLPEKDKVARADSDQLKWLLGHKSDEPGTEALLTVRGLSKSYGGVRAVSDVSFEVRRGEIFSLIGPNGAGKTTVLNCISGGVSGAGGEVLLERLPLGKRAAHLVADAGIARTFQGVRLFRPISVLENVIAGCFVWQRSSILGCALRLPSVRAEDEHAQSVAAACIEFVGIGGLHERRASELPYAAQRRVELARALAARPKLLLLDEPAAGMNPTEKKELGNLLIKIRDSGCAILLIEHDMPLVMSISNRVAVMDQGALIAIGKPGDVRRNPQVIDAYLGSEDKSPAVKPSGAGS